MLGRQMSHWEALEEEGGGDGEVEGKVSSN